MKGTGCRLFDKDVSVGCCQKKDSVVEDNVPSDKGAGVAQGELAADKEASIVETKCWSVRNSVFMER